MTRYNRWFFVILLFVFGITGCAVQEAILPTHDEVLIYELPLDLTYLRTVEALENVPGWELEETEKEKGIIRVRNVDYSNLIDADKRLVTFWVQRVDRNRTSVQIAPESQHVIGGDELLERVSQYVTRELQYH